jgi:hypothetical protein
MCYAGDRATVCAEPTPKDDSSQLHVCILNFVHS